MERNLLQAMELVKRNIGRIMRLIMTMSYPYCGEVIRADPTLTSSAMEPSSTSTIGIPPATTSSSGGNSGGGGGGGGGPTSSPLLFFVALGFGVVFTNLW